ncbi:uncharacterized protein LOC110900999 [Helianthus annuus]|uniref:uncharacterized protein LOC110900999 n=1 Tax=Helianthus annuus TaxID=4232 RepID=UPI000B8FF6F8|nr:uncharacterized protein LOC110900999 [Helianthus annuus]
MDMDDDPDPEMPSSGTPMHPIEISDGSSFHGSPYRGPDSYEARFASYPWEFTPPFQPQFQHQQQDPSEDSRFQAVTPPPPPPLEQQPHPEPPRRRRTTARMSGRGGIRISTPQPSSGNHYPPLYEGPQMGGPSNPVSEVESAPVAPPPSQMGYDNPIPSYAGAAAYNPFAQPAHTNYNYAQVDPYLQQQPQPPQIKPPQQQEILQRLSQVEREVQEERRSHRGFLKGLRSSYMAESEEVNSHPLENHDTTRINITGAELRELIDNAVSKAVDMQFKESSGTHSKTLSVPHSKSHPKTHSEAHSKPPSKHHESKKDDAQHSSNQHSVPSKKIVFDQEPRAKTCSYKYFVSCKPRDFTGEKGAIDCRHG